MFFFTKSDPPSTTENQIFIKLNTKRLKYERSFLSKSSPNNDRISCVLNHIEYKMNLYELKTLKNGNLIKSLITLITFSITYNFSRYSVFFFPMDMSFYRHFPNLMGSRLQNNKY